MELEQALSEKQKLEHQLANQELSAGDVQRLHSEMRQLNATLEAIEREKQEIDQTIWDEEKQIAKKQEHVRIILGTGLGFHFLSVSLTP